jgi:hypothetical protein
MSSSSPEWLPDGGIFLARAADPDVRPSRPWWQGDVFAGVTIPVLTMRKGEPQMKALEGRRAILLGHPCSIRGGGTLARAQNVAEVRLPRGKEAERLKPPWGTDLRLFPLPDLLGDGELHVADFNTIGTVAQEHLAGKRIACLNHDGWAAFQKRYGVHSLRIEQSLSDRRADTQAYWNEITIWEEWCSRGQLEGDYQAWLNEPLESGEYAGTIRRQALEFAPDAVEAELPDPASEEPRSA